MGCGWRAGEECLPQLQEPLWGVLHCFIYYSVDGIIPSLDWGNFLGLNETLIISSTTF